MLCLSEPSCRGRGFGKEATLLMMAYGEHGSAQEQECGGVGVWEHIILVIQAG